MSIQQGRVGSLATDVAAAGLAATVLSGIPSTIASLATGSDVLAPVRAAGSLLTSDPRRQSITGVAAHLALSFGWAAVLGRVLPRRRPLIEGLASGAVIAALDLGIVGRRFPLIRALPQVPQWGDHLAYGVIVSAVLTERLSSR